MENLDYIILFGLIILALYFINNKKQVIKKEKKINYSDIYVVKNNIETQNIISNENNNFVKKITEKEIKQINIEKGNTTRQSLIHESGGSTHYKEVKLNTNISGNKIIEKENAQSYRKLPIKIK